MKLLGALSLLALVSNAISKEYGLVYFTPEKGMIVPMEIVLSKRYMLSIPSKPENYKGCFDRTINYHDFHKGLVALKEIGGKKCFVKSTDETYKKSKSLLRAFNHGRTKPVHQAIEQWTIPKHRISTNKVKSTFGRRIAKFCAGRKVYRLQERSVKSTLKDLVKPEGVTPMCLISCGVCSIVMAVN